MNTHSTNAALAANENHAPQATIAELLAIIDAELLVTVDAELLAIEAECLTIEAERLDAIDAEMKRYAAELDTENKRYAAELEALNKRCAAEQEALNKRCAAEQEALNKAYQDENKNAAARAEIRLRKELFEQTGALSDAPPPM